MASAGPEESSDFSAVAFFTAGGAAGAIMVGGTGAGSLAVIAGSGFAASACGFGAAVSLFFENGQMEERMPIFSSTG